MSALARPSSQAIDRNAPVEHVPVDLLRVFAMWLPLAASFELMAVEGPSLQAVVGRLPHPELNLAAWGLTIGLSLLVESPVIMLLATSIAIVSDGHAFRVLRRFTLGLCVACTILTALLSFTPLYGFVTATLMRQPLDIRQAARPALQIMLLWTAAIGYRRFYQGVLVRYGYASRVSYGTVFRLTSILTVALLMVWTGRFSGVVAAALAIMSGVITEATATRLFARVAVREVQAHPSTGDSLTLRAVLRFHGPLAATTLLTLLVEPLNSAALAWLPQARITLAAWPVAFMSVFIIRGLSFPLQETAVALATRSDGRRALHRFTRWVGVVTSILLAVLAFTPLLHVYLVKLLDTPPVLLPFVRTAVGLCVLQPFFTATGAFNRGVLMAFHRTGDVYRGMGASLLAQIVLLVLLVRLGWPGMWVAALSSSGSTLIEYLWLRRCASRLC